MGKRLMQEQVFKKMGCQQVQDTDGQHNLIRQQALGIKPNS